MADDDLAVVDNAMIDAYLTRLGLDREPVSADALARLHRRHVERIPYETAWIHSGELWSTDPVASMERIVFDGRGGYCYHLNGAFSLLLRSLGYDATVHVGGVHDAEPPDESAMGSHAAVTVSALPTEGNPDGRWLVDAGLGDSLHGPLPLVEGRHVDGAFDFVVRRTLGAAANVGDWQLLHHPAGSFTGMVMRTAPAPTGAFEEQHRRLSTSPDSGFVKTMVVQRRDARGADILRGQRVVRIGSSIGEWRTIEQRNDWFDVLDDIFGLHLRDHPRADGLWERVHARHEAWQRAE